MIERAALDVLLKQYEFLRDEITRCIYLEHIAILGLFSSLGLVFATLLGKIIGGESNPANENTIFIMALILAQIIISGFGSLFLNMMSNSDWKRERKN